MSSARQLAAIMFTDIVGYTALMGKDEQKAFELLRKNRQIHKPAIERYKGKLLKEIGDGILASFPTVSDAVYCALEIRNKSEREGHYRLRIGIHLGEVVFEKHDVFGDGVNIASRIQSIAEAGEILVSESVYRNIANQKGLQVEFLREEYLKNVDTPVKISRVTTKTDYEEKNYRSETRTKSKNKPIILFISIIVLLVAVYLLYAIFYKETNPVIAVNASTEQKKSLAVLPFKNLGNDKDQEFLGDGIAEEILNVLYNTMKDLKVPGRTSCFSFKNKVTDLITIGKILGVKYILEGSVQRSADNISVRVFLNDAETGYQIKTWEYNKQFREVISLQDEIAKDISAELKLSLFDNVLEQPVSVNTEAYQLVLKGNFYFNKGPAGLPEAIEYYKKAITADSIYAYPHVRLGWAYYQQTLFGKYPSRTGFVLARGEVEKALQLKLSTPDKHSVYKTLAYINLWSFEWKKANDEYQKLIAVNPKRDDFSSFYESLALGHTAEAVLVFQKISEENPIDVLNLRDYAILQYLDRKYSNALQTCDKILELDSVFSEAFRIKGHIYAARNRPDSALVFFSKAASLGNEWGQLLSIITLPMVGRKAEAEKIFLEAEKMNPATIPAMAKALIYHSLGQKEKAMDWLNKSYEAKDFWLASLRVDPLWDPIRSENGFDRLIKKMNFQK
jgi:adenylate cyclase